MTKQAGADMSSELSQIEQYYSGKSVFITGASGFLGKLLMEKLLRMSSDIAKIYILIREKKGKSIEKRFEEMLENPVFDRLKKERPNFTQTIELVPGDCVMPELGLDEATKKKLVKSVNCVFHCAATVRFDEKIRTASYINVRATRDLLVMAKQMPNLTSFVYVSTAFSQCIQDEIEEKFYETTFTGEKLLTLLESSDDDFLDRTTPIILEKWPNTYAFTKAVAEEVIQSGGSGFPVAVVRPSIVAATAKEPVSGWIDNMYGATGCTVGVALGLVRTIHCNKECLADIVPADYVINCMLAAAWKMSSQSEQHTEVPIYNYVSSIQNPITWQKWMKYSETYLKQVPSHLQVWHYFFFMNSNYYMNLLCIFLLHTVPAYVVDFLARCVGKPPMLVKGYQKINKFLYVLSYFTTRNFNFSNDNTQCLWKCMNTSDKERFDFDMGSFEWDPYFYTFSRGGRVYLLKDPLDTLPQGRRKYLKLQIAHYVLLTVLFLVFSYLVVFLFCYLLKL